MSKRLRLCQDQLESVRDKSDREAGYFNRISSAAASVKRRREAAVRSYPPFPDDIISHVFRAETRRAMTRVGDGEAVKQLCVMRLVSRDVRDAVDDEIATVSRDAVLRFQTLVFASSEGAVPVDDVLRGGFALCTIGLHPGDSLGTRHAISSAVDYMVRRRDADKYSPKAMQRTREASAVREDDAPQSEARAVVAQTPPAHFKDLTKSLIQLNNRRFSVSETGPPLQHVQFKRVQSHGSIPWPTAG